MPPVDSVFRPFRPSDAERSDRAAGDRARHREKVRQAIRENIADIIAEESIIGKDRDRIIKVPIRGIKEYRFIYGNAAPGVGQGNGESQPGQVVGRHEADRPGPAGSRRRPAGHRLLRDRRQPRRADRADVRGSRAARPRAQAAARDPRRPHRQAQGIPPGRHPPAPRQAPHRAGAGQAHDGDARAASERGRATTRTASGASRSTTTISPIATWSPTSARSPTPSWSASWTPRARWTR